MLFERAHVDRAEAVERLQGMDPSSESSTRLRAIVAQSDRTIPEMREALHLLENLRRTAVDEVARLQHSLSKTREEEEKTEAALHAALAARAKSVESSWLSVGKATPSPREQEE